MHRDSKLKLLSFIVGALFLCSSHSVFSQINIKVGYSIGYADLGTAESVFDRFNAINPQAEQVLSPARFYHGVDLGLRYKFSNWALDLGLSSASGNSEAINVFQENGSLGNDEWRISLVNYYIGLENRFGPFGIGANIGNQTMKFGTNFSNTSGKRTVYEETALNSKFYFIIEVPSKSVAFSLRPYVSTTWAPYNLSEVEQLFDPQSTIPESELDQDLVMFGISFLFYNGPQRR